MRGSLDVEHTLRHFRSWPKFATKKQSIEGIDSFLTAAI
jgi:hypothetical protein